MPAIMLVVVLFTILVVIYWLPVPEEERLLAEKMAEKERVKRAEQQKVRDDEEAERKRKLEGKGEEVEPLVKE